MECIVETNGPNFITIHGESFRSSMFNKEGKLIYEKFGKAYWTGPKLRNDWRKKYDLYLATNRWYELRTACLERFSGRCALCNSKATLAHHRDYPDVLGTEDQSYLVALCHACHDRHHNPYKNLEDLKGALLKEALEGHYVKCPLCGEGANTNDRCFNRDHAHALMWLVEQFEKNGGEWVDFSKKNEKNIPKSIKKIREYGRLVVWRLAEPHRYKEALFIPTPKGIQLIKEYLNGTENTLKIPYKITEWHSIPIKIHDEKMLTIEEAFGVDFGHARLRVMHLDLITAYELRRIQWVIEKNQRKQERDKVKVEKEARKKKKETAANGN